LNLSPFSAHPECDFFKASPPGPRREPEAEVERLTPLVDEGGFILHCDHRVPADVPLANYIQYVKEAKRVWGMNLPNLRPMGFSHNTWTDSRGGGHFFWRRFTPEEPPAEVGAVQVGHAGFPP